MSEPLDTTVGRPEANRPLWTKPLDKVAQRQDRIGALARWLADSFVLGCLLRFVRINGRDRILVMASQAFTAMIPLLIVISSFSSDNDALADGMVERFHLSGNGESAMRVLFTRPANAASALTLVGLVVLFYSTMALARYVQRTYQSAWDLPPVGIVGTLNSVLGLALLIGQVVFLSWLSGLVGELRGHQGVVILMHLAIASVLWLQVQYLLLSRRVPRRALVPGSITAAAGQAVVSIYSATWMPHIVSLNSVRYGVIGVTFALLTWLIVVCAGVVAAAVVSAEWAQRAELVPHRMPRV
ncbi:YhjD/YihY/BrkB family envelope integrity protein [Angustibacter luteus]|uniref:YhjD/YihY/BrkB family envelope integrity protein n=1 Tax=Angustibacter luteus TaxID=658456 RepID=A0ABW1JCD8_9ACTN